MSGRRGLACAMALLLGQAPAHAVLGGDMATVQADALQWRAQRRQVAALDHVVHELHWPDGSVVAQHVNAQGRVFLVAWRINGKPRLAALLGAYEADYRRALAAGTPRPGVVRDLSVTQGDLVLRASAHLNRHVGTARALSLSPRAPAGLRQ